MRQYLRCNDGIWIFIRPYQERTGNIGYPVKRHPVTSEKDLEIKRQSTIDRNTSKRQTWDVQHILNDFSTRKSTSVSVRTVQLLILHMGFPSWRLFTLHLWQMHETKHCASHEPTSTAITLMITGNSLPYATSFEYIVEIDVYRFKGNLMNLWDFMSTEECSIWLKTSEVMNAIHGIWGSWYA